MCVAIIKEALGDHVEGWWYNLTSVFENAWSKLLCTVASFFSLQIVGFYGDEILLSLLFKFMIIDLIVGVIDAIKSRAPDGSRKWDPKILLVRGISKFPIYALYIYMVAAVDHGAERTFHTSLPIIELFYLYMLSGEAYSICRHLKYIGIKVPEPLLWLAFGFRKNTEKKIKQVAECISEPVEQEPPKHPPSEDDN